MEFTLGEFPGFTDVEISVYKANPTRFKFPLILSLSDK